MIAQYMKELDRRLEEKTQELTDWTTVDNLLFSICNYVREMKALRTDRTSAISDAADKISDLLMEGKDKACDAIFLPAASSIVYSRAGNGN